MPELPEVETVVSDLNKKVKGRTIRGVWFDWPKMIKDVAKQSRLRVSRSAVVRFQKDIVGEKIVRAKRLGKNILIYLTSNKLLLVHQKMTGHLLLGRWQVKGNKVVPQEPAEMVTDPFNGYIHLIFYLDDGRMLALSDLRKFAKVILGGTKDIENLTELTDLGPDALSKALTFKKFSALIRENNRAIKKVLLDQTVIAGIGNIYSDDMLWFSGIHPLCPASSLSTGQLRALYRAMRGILKKAVRLRGTSTSDFRDVSGKEGRYTRYRLIYQREAEPCARCKTPIERLKVGGRSAHYCPKCQVR